MADENDLPNSECPAQRGAKAVSRINRRSFRRCDGISPGETKSPPAVVFSKGGSGYRCSFRHEELLNFSEKHAPPRPMFLPFVRMTNISFVVRLRILFFEKVSPLFFLFAYGIGSVMVIGRMLYGKYINNKKRPFGQEEQ
ncbi:MAG: hypothetical protein HGA48_03910 [Candidatus Yonathbacteria bacterium]|nr:hypothetical protein [Candidatus Yonathbacteria bacterium]